MRNTANKPYLAIHVTDCRNLQSILSTGLMPMIGERSREIGEQVPRIYLFPSREACEDGLGNWLGDALDDDNELVLLEINLVGLRVDSAAGYELSVTERILPHQIVAAYDECWNALPNVGTQQSSALEAHGLNRDAKPSQRLFDSLQALSRKLGAQVTPPEEFPRLG